MIKEGDKAPAIKLETDSGEQFDLAKHKGKRVVVFFYPRADTPGCTIEAREFTMGGLIRAIVLARYAEPSS